ncbi:hypothetical protein H0920_10580 [Acinetobacter sp. C_4_1]|uniref:hypothetical protein n=1 Tax=unclassified Acinetobacter TaxID=196816 RepID=UPI0021B7921F|nr:MULTISPECIES: hypothetical protein [unclassified Acinetobacter]MCT8090727.1 hypothetical protein [Acinetobacter sp. F_3_1]MCT8101541.1 hypothetical protein [Acinetobacter sp. C_4_1]MCT8135124.1 hypothetical protein [Acinetobacter sp. T_3_1]
MRKIILVIIALVLTACGGGSANGDNNKPPMAPTPVIPSEPPTSNPSEEAQTQPEIPSSPDEIATPSMPSKATFNLTNGIGWIKSGLFDIGIKVFNPVTYNESAVFNFNNDKFDGKVIRKNGDDAAPVRMMGATIGGRHGYSRTILTLQQHDKTISDVGSVWTDGSKEWVITQIISPTEISITSRRDNTSFRLGGTLIHVSGATNTTAFKPLSVTAKQWYPMLKNHSVKVHVDDKSVIDTTLTTGFNDSLKISESYDLMEKSDIVEWLILNGGKEVKSYNAESALNVNNIHSFDVNGGDTIYARFFTYKGLSSATDLMFTQSARMQAVNGEVLYYVPRSIAFTHESVNYNFSKPTDVTNLTITNRIDFTAARTETGAVLPDRLVMLSGDLGYATGYLPVLDAAPDVRNTLTSKGIQISQFDAKVYPYIVDGLKTLGAGASYSGVAYRKYFKRPIESRRTTEYDIRSDLGNFLFLDWHGGEFTDVITLPEHLQGRTFEVVEKTDNVKILTPVATNTLSVSIGMVTSNARLILKFK